MTVRQTSRATYRIYVAALCVAFAVALATAQWPACAVLALGAGARQTACRRARPDGPWGTGPGAPLPGPSLPRGLPGPARP